MLGPVLSHVEMFVEVSFGKGRFSQTRSVKKSISNLKIVSKYGSTVKNR